MTRAQGPIYKTVWFIASMFSLWIAVLIFGRFLEPLADIISGMEAVKESGYGGHIDLYLTGTMYAFILLGVGVMVLFVVWGIRGGRLFGPSRRRRPRP